MNLKKISTTCIIILQCCMMTYFVHTAYATRRPNNDSKASYPKLGEISYYGVHSLSPTDLEKTLPITLGDRWDDSLVQISESNIKSYYASRGFYNATVNAKKIINKDGEIKLELRIQEGIACAYDSIGVSDPPTLGSVALDRKFKNDLLKALSLKSGDRYDKETLTDNIRLLREYLANENYILADVDEIRTDFSQNKEKVSIDIKVKYGPKITFGFIGNKIFSRGELNEFILQLKTTDLGKDFEGVVKRKIDEEYRKNGYSSVEISSYFERNGVQQHLTFVIQENSRAYLTSLNLEGINRAEIELAKAAYYDAASRLTQRGYYVEKDVERGAQAVIEYLRSRGYLMSKVVSKSIEFNKLKNEYTVGIQFLEGDRTIVSDVTVTGNTHYSVEEIINFLKLKVSDGFNPYAFEEALQELRRRYINEGYLNSVVAPEPDKIALFSDKNRKVSIGVNIEEGQRIKLGHITIEGLGKTRRYIVEREIKIKQGDWWLASDIYDLEDSLKRLGIFAEVRSTPVASNLGAEYRDLSLELREGEPGVLEFGPGFRSDLGGRVFARLSYNNLLGRNQTMTLAGDANRRIGGVFPYRFIEYNLQGTATDPRLFGSRNALTLGLNTSRRQFIDFNAVQAQFFATIDRKVFIPQLLGKLTYKIERIRQFDAPDAVDNQTLLIGTVAPTLTLDTRDNPFTASRGQVTSFTFEYAHPTLVTKALEAPDAVHYYKWSGSNHFYIPLPKGIVWSNVVAGGFARNLTGDRNVVPLIKTFRLGGYASVRGFREDSINRDKVQIKGTLSFINLRSQFDLPLAGDLKVAPFLDAGNVYVDNLRSFPFLRVGAGLGLHYMTPVGPINFDYGINLNRRSNESGGQFHFSVGII